MAESPSVTTLKNKRDEIETYIRTTERHLAQARQDLVHVKATLRLFDIGVQHSPSAVYVSVTHLFAKHEIPKLVLECIQASPEGVSDTRRMAAHVMKAKGWDATDKALCVSITGRITHYLCMAKKARKFEIAGKRDGVNLWRTK